MAYGAKNYSPGSQDRGGHMPTAVTLTGGSLNRRNLFAALDILGSYGGYSATSIKSAIDARADHVPYHSVQDAPPPAHNVDAFDRIHDRDEARQLARRALSALTPREREVVEYRYGFRGYPMLFQSVAAVLGVTEGTVKALHHRAMGKMRDVLVSA